MTEMKYRNSDLIQQLIEHEGLRLDVYKDSLGIPTIGVGRNLRDRGLTQKELTDLGFRDTIDVWEFGLTRQQAEYLLLNDIKIVETELAKAHPCIHGLNSVRQRVLVDMAFNLGMPRLNQFKNMWAAIHNDDFITAAKEMLDSRWATQVGNRAKRLAKAMECGKWLEN